MVLFFFQAEDGIRDYKVTGVQTCALPISEEMLKTRKEDLKGKTALVSGSGNVAQYTVEKLITLGAKPVTLSDSTGFIYDNAGVTRDKLAFVMNLKNVRRGRIAEYADKFKEA